MHIKRIYKRRAANAGIVIAIAFACGFILQDSELLGAAPNLPGKVPLSAIANGNADAEFTSGRTSVTSSAGVVVFLP